MTSRIVSVPASRVTVQAPVVRQQVQARPAASFMSIPAAAPASNYSQTPSPTYGIPSKGSVTSSGASMVAAFMGQGARTVSTTPIPGTKPAYAAFNPPSTAAPLPSTAIAGGLPPGFTLVSSLPVTPSTGTTLPSAGGATSSGSSVSSGGSGDSGSSSSGGGASDDSGSAAPYPSAPPSSTDLSSGDVPPSQALATAATAPTFLQAHGKTIAIGLGILVALGVGYYVWTKDA